MKVLLSVVGKRSEHWLGLFRALASRGDMELHVLAADLTPQAVKELRALEREGSVCFLHARHHLGERVTGHMASIVYAGSAWRLCPAAVDLIHVIGEASYPTTIQVLRYRDRADPSVPVTLYGAQNVLQRFPWPFRRFEQYALRQIALATPVSRAAAEVLRRKGYRGPTAVIPLGVDTDLFQERSSPPRPPFTVGFVGRLEEHKGIELLLAAVERVKCRLLVVGDGSLRAKVARAAREGVLAGQVELVPWVSHADLVPLLGRMDVLVLPSVEVVQRRVVPWIGIRLQEQFGRVACEAMACGVPVIGSDLGEIPRVVGAGGLVFPPGDLNELARAIARVRDEPQLAAALGKTGAERARRTLAWNRVADMYRRTWAEALALGPRTAGATAGARQISASAA
jgi:glycosyltransferase involved in cell wall biosynthesis